MYFLDGCPAGLAPVLGIVNFVINAIMIGVPILLIVLGMVDLGKAVIASKEDEVKKATKAFGKRVLYAVAVFCVVWLVKMVLSWVPNLVNDAGDTTEWQGCWSCVVSRGQESGGCNFTN